MQSYLPSEINSPDIEFKLRRDFKEHIVDLGLGDDGIDLVSDLETVAEIGDAIFLGPITLDEADPFSHPSAELHHDVGQVDVYRAYAILPPEFDPARDIDQDGHRASTQPFRVGLAIGDAHTTLTAVQTALLTCELLSWLTTLAQAGGLDEKHSSPAAALAIMILHDKTSNFGALLEALGVDINGERVGEFMKAKAAANAAVKNKLSLV